MIQYTIQPIITTFMSQVLTLSLDMKCQNDVSEYVNAPCHMSELKWACDVRHLRAIVCGEFIMKSSDLLFEMWIMEKKLSSSYP